tara:strand:- start:425 stop:982 length:558 start_codon:yes stop_codon:yes gene_type:complete
MKIKKTTKEVKIDEKFIQESLKYYYDSGARYMVPNIHFFDYGYGETDLLVVREGKKRLIYDIEIKVSKADYKRDFKKVVKHERLEKGTLTKRRRWSFKPQEGKRRMIKANEALKLNDRPNRFFFAVPEGLITEEELPPYAGLLYIDNRGNVTKIKEGKLLHKEEVPHEARLCRKFYFYWLNALKK